MGQETYEYAFHCPCGQGLVTNRVTSYDNGYSRDSHSVSVQCDACQRAYTFKQILDFDRGTVMTATNTTTREKIELIPRESA